MGDRGQVYIKDEGVYLYTHWNASELVETVRKALAKRWRWDDPSYLARIIFDEMIGPKQGSETGFGISTTKAGDAWLLIEIDCKNQTVTIKDYTQNKSIAFEEFIK